jgi:acyl dehydratase
MTPRWEELREGSAPPPLTVGPLTRTDFVRYQGASGDLNPVHHDEPFARAAGYPSVLGVGMFPAGVLTAWAAEWLGPANVRRVRIRWKEPVWPGDLLTCRAEIARAYEESGERRVDVKLLCSRQTGAAAVEATATFVVPAD